MAREETVVLDFDVDVEDSIESIDKLTAANKELRKERNALNISTEQGQKRAAELNAKIDDNTAKIKNNVSAIEKQKINIGNYKSALDGIDPALGRVGEGLQAGTAGLKAMTLQALAFIATPIGAIIAALAAVFVTLKAAISTNNEVLDKFENITNAIGIVIDVVINRVGKLGEALIALANGNFSEAAELTSAAFSGLAEEIGNAVRAGQLYLNLARDLEDAQRALRVETAKQENEIKRLVVAAKNRNLTFDEQEALLRKALVLEEQLVDKRAELAQKDLVITAKTVAQKKALYQTEEETFQQFLDRITTNGKLSDEEVDNIIGKIEALETARGSSLAFQEKLENSLTAIQEKRAAALEKQNAALKEQAERQAFIDGVNRRNASRQDPNELDQFADDLKLRTSLNKDYTSKFAKELDERAKLTDKAAKESTKAKQKELEVARIVEEQKLQATAAVFGAISGLLDEQSTAYKLAATAQVLVSTYATAQKAYEAAFLPIPTVASPGIGAAFAAAAIINGLVNVAKINGIEFAEGGWTGPGHKMKPAGIVHADEYVVPKHVLNSPSGGLLVGQLEGMRRGYADGGFVTNSVSQPVNAQLALANIVKNMPAGEISIKEFSKVKRRVDIKEQISKR